MTGCFQSSLSDGIVNDVHVLTEQNEVRAADLVKVRYIVQTLEREVREVPTVMLLDDKVGRMSRSFTFQRFIMM